jgi:hypothetical protein
MNSIDLATGRCRRCGSVAFSTGQGCPRCDTLTCDTSSPVPPLPCLNCATERAAREKAELERDELLVERACIPTSVADMRRAAEMTRQTAAEIETSTKPSAGDVASAMRNVADVMDLAANMWERVPPLPRGLAAEHAELLSEVATLRAELRQARELIRDLRDWHGHRGELILDAWERIASEFQADTGMLRPGKSQSPEACHSDEERQTRFREWCEARHNGLTGRIRIALHAAGLVED